MGIWIEIVTLLIPGFNDSDEELRQLTEFLADVSPDIPWHVTAFHQDYKMTSPPIRARKTCSAPPPSPRIWIAYIYAGNLSGQVKLGRHTLPSVCALLIQRHDIRSKSTI